MMNQKIVLILFSLTFIYSCKGLGDKSEIKNDNFEDLKVEIKKE